MTDFNPNLTPERRARFTEFALEIGGKIQEAEVAAERWHFETAVAAIEAERKLWETVFEEAFLAPSGREKFLRGVDDKIEMTKDQRDAHNRRYDIDQDGE